MKVLIVTEVIAGLGHLKAAKSLEKVFKLSYPNYEIKIEYSLSIFNKNIEKIVSFIYYNLIFYTPRLWGYIHHKESQKSSISKKIISYILIPRLSKFIKKEKPELVIATHACGLGALSILKEKHCFCLAAVFTDYQVNNYWVNKNIDYYFVPHKELKNELTIRYKVNPKIIFDTGIPIDPIFSKKNKVKKNKCFLTGRNNIKLLIMGGGLGIGKIKELILLLNNLNTVSIYLTVITGANNLLYQELIKLKSKLDIPINIYEYSNNICYEMKKNDLLISKPGGLTISEALSTQIPIIIYDSLPGQEEENAKFLLKMKSAIRVKEIKEIPCLIKYLYNNPKTIQKIMDYQFRIAKPNSSAEIIKILGNNLNKSVLIKQKTGCIQ
ncbi:MAG: glycosyltransferase [Vulcanibacillus sp.]